MALIDDAVLLMIPSGYKAGTLYNVLPNTAAGDFTVANAGTKFRTNSDLKLEEIAENVPALDYSAVGGCPHVKLNEANTNLLEYPLSFGHSDWTKSGATLEGDPSTASADLNVSTLVSLSYTTFVPTIGNESTGFTATSDGLGNDFGGTADEINIVNGNMYLIEFDLTLNSGILPNECALRPDGSSSPISRIIIPVEGNNSFYLTATSTTTGLFNFRNSSSITNYTVSNLSVKQVTGYPSPSVTYPTDAYLFTATATDGSIKLTTDLASAAYNNSWYVKRATGTGVVSLIDASDTDIEIAVTGGWQRFDANATGTQCGLKLADSGDAVYIAFAQTSAKTYAPTFTYSGTEGATSSMLADAITGAGDAATFASVNASGVLYAEISALSNNDGVPRAISISDGTSNNWIYLRYSASINTAAVYSKIGGVTKFWVDPIPITAINTIKIAIRWKVDNFGLWINGIEIPKTAGDEDVVFGANVIDRLNFSEYDNDSPFYGNTKQVAVYNYLDDAAMVILTTP